MYTAFYGLREKPFALSPDPRFLYLAGSHREALAHLLYGIEQGEGFISVTGEVGTGKTTLCRTMLEQLDGDTEIAFLFNPSRSALELLQSICAEFDLPAEGLTRRTLMGQLNDFLVEQKRTDRRVLLIIDEAQTLSDNTLEQVRLLSNLETSRDKLIQILLLGQPELDRKLDGRNLRQLRQRISVRWQLEPLSAPETRAYVRHRLAVAAGEPKELFSETALREVHRRTGGIPRLVNQLCDRALLGGYAARASQIGPRLVRAAAREIPDADPRRRRTAARPGESSEAGVDGQGRIWSRPWTLFATSLLLVGFSLWAGLQVGRSGLSGLVGAPSSPATRESSSVELADTARGQRPGEPPGVAAPPPLGRLIGPVTREPAADEGGVAPAAATASIRESGLEIPAPSPTTALGAGLLGRALSSRPPAVALGASHRELLQRYGRLLPGLSTTPLDPKSLVRSFESRGLGATLFEGGSIDLLRRLDHPVAIALDLEIGRRVAPRRGESAADLEARRKSAQADRERRGAAAAAGRAADTTRWLALVGFDGDRALLAGLIDDQDVSVPISELQDHWLETGVIVWEQYESVPLIVSPGDEGPGVLWLQRSLAELRLFPGEPNSRFDERTASALGRFQRERGLVSDGVAGPLTQIALYGRLARYPVPRLSASAPDARNVPAASARAQSGDGVAPAVPPAAPETEERG